DCFFKKTKRRNTMKVINRVKEIPIKKTILVIFASVAVLTISQSLIYMAIKIVDKIDGVEALYSREF
ncbi:hypothetical protein, partial [Enterobacter cloacae complex sp. 418I7]|uniref:hypothetical protein n=1 Tax=Enterobacter cloacae complex sp. 418I7 TaxID=3395839 RepID=UPI003CEDFF5E